MKINNATRIRIKEINHLGKIIDERGIEPTTDFGTTIEYNLYDVSISTSPKENVVTVKYSGEKEIIRDIEELKDIMKYLRRALRRGIKNGY